jgi:hypothetical protein
MLNEVKHLGSRGVPSHGDEILRFAQDDNFAQEEYFAVKVWNDR